MRLMNTESSSVLFRDKAFLTLYDDTKVNCYVSSTPYHPYMPTENKDLQNTSSLLNSD